MKKLITCLILVLLVASVASAQLQRTVMEQSPDGTSFKTQRTVDVSLPLPVAEARSDYLVGQRSIDVLIYAHCGVAVDGYYSGVQNGSPTYPAVVENLAMDGSVVWSYESDRADYTFATRGAALVQNDGIAGATVMGNHDGTDWGWSVDLGDCTPRCMVQTPDGSVVAVGVNKDANGQIVCFDGLTGAILSTFDLPANGWARVLDITDDGSLVASRGNTLQVIETATGNALYNQSAGASCDVVGLSSNGQWLVAGWTYMEVYERAGDTYVLRWSHRRVPGSYASYARVNSNGDIVCALNTGQYNQTYVHMVNATDADHSGVLYEGPVNDDGVQEVVKDIYFGDQSNLAVLGNWGDADGDTPEVMVFEFGDAHPVATLDTRGSIYAVDGRISDTGGLEIAACGKQVHANTMGNGGDYYIMYIPAVVAIDDPDETPDNDLLVTALAGAHPNPFNPMTRVVFTLDRTQNVTLSVFDVTGRLVAELADGSFASGEHAVLWDGRDRAGREVPSGNYLAVMTTDERVRTAKMMLVR